MKPSSANGTKGNAMILSPGLITVSRGQGSYLPSANGLNVNGKHIPQKGYITDELTDYALDWLKGRQGGKPFMLYLSHKAVHSEFVPADRHKDRYKSNRSLLRRQWTPPITLAAPYGCAISGTVFMVWTFLTTEISILSSTTNAMQKRCWRSTRALAG